MISVMTDPEIQTMLEKRFGKVFTQLRLGIESDDGYKLLADGRRYSNPEYWVSKRSLISACLKVSGFYNRGVRNARDVQVRHNHISLQHLPDRFEGFTILHLSDLHADMDIEATRAVARVISDLEYDICVLTGDFRARTHVEYQYSMDCMAIITTKITRPAYGVPGNHDSILMVPGLESQGITMLVNESTILERGDQKIAIAGIDDAHYFRTHNLVRAAEAIPENTLSVLLSHTPEVYRQASHANFDIMFSGHTHGGQICLPGGIPLTLDSRCPRALGAGSWQYRNMAGYTSVGSGTSVVNVRLNCLPEVTLHTLNSPAGVNNN